MTTPKSLCREYPLPLGFRTEFTWTGDAMSVVWKPRLPEIDKVRVRRKMLHAYQGARNDFLRDVAAIIGGTVAAIDLDGSACHLTAIKAPTKN